MYPMDPLLDLVPITESEMLNFPVEVKVHLLHTISSRPVPYYCWRCFCGRKCNIAAGAGTTAGTCLCFRDWSIDTIDMTAIVIEPRIPKYDFPIVIDRDRSWKLWRRPNVGL
jgi:hypothetical protein